MLKNRMCVSWKSFVFLLLLHAGLHGLAAAELCQHQGTLYLTPTLSHSPTLSLSYTLSPILSLSYSFSLLLSLLSYSLYLSCSLSLYYSPSLSLSSALSLSLSRKFYMTQNNSNTTRPLFFPYTMLAITHSMQYKLVH